MIITNTSANPITLNLGRQGRLDLPPGVFITPTPDEEEAIQALKKGPFLQALLDQKMLVLSEKKLGPEEPRDLVSDPEPPQKLTDTPEKNGKKATRTVKAEGVEGNDGGT